MPDNPAFWSASRQSAAIRAGELSSRELIELYVERIEQINPRLNAVVTHDVAGARAAATVADDAIARGEGVGPLHGLPVTIKDALETAHLRSTGGAVELRDHIPQRDAPVVQALKQAGAIVIGKTNLPRWSADVQTFNEMFGVTVNPWDSSRVPGGSSGGAAAAVAAGLTSFEIGTDIAGSIRIPAAFCGVFGHKPSFGLVPSSGYLDHPGGGTTESDMNVIGPIARSAEDLALLLDVIARKDPPWVVRLDSPPADLRTLRVAAWLDDSFCKVDAEVLQLLTTAADRLDDSGITVDRNARPEIDPVSAFDTGMELLGGAMIQASRSRRFGPSHRAWLDAHAAREAMRARWADFFTRYDAILMPATFVPPFPHLHEGTFSTRTLICNGEERPYRDILSWTVLPGMAYLPSTVPPIGPSRSGLPVGVQVVGAYGSDLLTIRLAGRIAELCGGYHPPPSMSD